MRPGVRCAARQSARDLMRCTVLGDYDCEVLRAAVSSGRAQISATARAWVIWGPSRAREDIPSSQPEMIVGRPDGTDVVALDQR